MIAPLQKLRTDQDGVTAVEFALVVPVLLLTLFGMFDLGHGMYTKSLLLGAIEKASRDSTIEGATTNALDARVASVVKQIAPNATLSFSRKSYMNFSNVKQPEDFSDGNSDGACNVGETFEDANGNGVWDADRARIGNGGARDAVLYKVTVTYPRLFPVYKFVNQSNDMTMTAVSVLRNQPFSLQNGASTMGTC